MSTLADANSRLVQSLQITEEQYSGLKEMVSTLPLIVAEESVKNKARHSTTSKIISLGLLRYENS